MSKQRSSIFIEKNTADEKRTDKTAIYSALSLTNRARMIIILLGIFVIVTAILLALAFLINGESLTMHFKTYIKNEVRSNISIKDNSGNPVYGYNFFENAYSDDKETRIATFHLLGNRYGAIPGSILDTEPEKLMKYSKITGYKAGKRDINLTVDLNLQKGAQKMLSDGGYNGAIVVVDYKTGEIKALASTPGIDPFTAEDSPMEDFMSKALDTFTPGSVFKTVTAAAILEKTEDIKNFTYTCTGKDGEISCYNKNRHGTQTLSEILKNSCNCGMAAAAKKYLTADELDSFARSCGILSSDAANDMKAGEGHINSAENFGWSANGQGEDTVSPLGAALYFSAIANGGKKLTLSIMKENLSGKSEQIMKESTAEYLKTSLYPVAQHRDLSYKAAAKTGTAELDSGASHSWIAMFLCDDNAPTYTIVTFLKNGGISTNAKNLTVKFINNYIKNK